MENKKISEEFVKTPLGDTKYPSEFTNKELLRELAKRIVDNRLEVENCINCQASFERQSGLVNLCIWDNEWQDKTKPDHTGARTNLNYWIMEIRQNRKEYGEDL